MMKERKNNTVVAITLIAVVMSMFVVIFAINTNKGNPNIVAYAEEISTQEDMQNEYGNIMPMNLGGDEFKCGCVHIDSTNESDFTNRFYIRNAQYFKNNPLHHANYKDDKENVNDPTYFKTGTCTTVAVQMLLGYHNYYTDRRLLLKQYLPEDYGDLSKHPARFFLQNSSSDLGESAIGTTDKLFDDIFAGTTFGGELNQTLSGVIAGAKRVLRKNNNIKFESISIVQSNYSYDATMAELEAGRPVLLRFDPIAGNATSYHLVVAYGYATYNGTFGYIANFGWENKDAWAWVPASWIGSMVTMNISHTHNYSSYDSDGNLINPDNNEIKCTECKGNYIAYRYIVSSSKAHIKDFYYKGEGVGKIFIPATFEKKKVIGIDDYAFEDAKMDTIVLGNQEEITYIGEGAFKNCNKLVSFSMPDQLSTIEPYTFYGCSSLASFSMPNQLTTIGSYAFYDCSSLTSFNMLNQITTIGAYAFYGCSSLIACNMSDQITTIEPYTFYGCSSLAAVGGLDSITTVGDYAFYEASLALMKELPKNVVTIGDYAYYGTHFLSSFTLGKNPKITSIGKYAFCHISNLTDLVVPSSITTIGIMAFSSPNLTLYTNSVNTPSGWSVLWAGIRPKICQCAISSDKTYVVSFTKSSNNPIISEELYVVNNPKRDGYTFGGWQDSNGNTYEDIASAPDGLLTAVWTEKSCVAEGSLITLADGTQKAVEELTGEEMLLVWNLFTGTFDYAPILFIDSDPSTIYEVINLTFSDGTVVKVIDEHAFWDFDLNEYVFLRSDASRYIGHYFNKQTTDENGNLIWTRVKLIGVNIAEEYISAWSPVTYGHLCYYVNGMLSMPGATEGLINIFEVDPIAMKFDATKMSNDIATYGLFTYEEFYEMYAVPEVIFEAFGGQYLKVAIGKGILTYDDITRLIERYGVFFQCE